MGGGVYTGVSGFAGCAGGVYTGVDCTDCAGGVYTGGCGVDGTYVTVGCTGPGAGRGADCAFETAENVVAPQRGQKEAPDFSSLLQFEQYTFGAAKGRPQPEQKVSPRTYGVLQFGQRVRDEADDGNELTIPAGDDGTYIGSDETG